MRTLVLNLDMRPLTTISVFRALRLLESSKVWRLIDFEQPVRSPSREYVAPAVVVLNKYINVPNAVRGPTKKLIFLRDGFMCQYCGGKAENIDHIIPRSKGGPHTWDNVVACCYRCNGKKGDRPLVETGMELMTMPGPMSYVKTYLGQHDEWDLALQNYANIK